VVTLFTSPPDLSVVFFLFCLFVFVVVCLVLLSLVAVAFLANKDVYISPLNRIPGHAPQTNAPRTVAAVDFNRMGLSSPV